MLGRWPSNEEIAAQGPFTLERIRFLDQCNARRDTTSVDELRRGGKDERNPLDTIGDKQVMGQIESQHLQQDLAAVMDGTLNERELTVLRKWFGLKPERRSYSLATIGQYLGLSTERARQLKNRALMKLKEVAEEWTQ